MGSTTLCGIALSAYSPTTDHFPRSETVECNGDDRQPDQAHRCTAGLVSCLVYRCLHDRCFNSDCFCGLRDRIWVTTRTVQAFKEQAEAGRDGRLKSAIALRIELTESRHWTYGFHKL